MRQDIAYAVEESTFDKMHELERRGAFKAWKMRPYNQADPDSYKVRARV